MKNPGQKIKELEAQGLRVYVRHRRPLKPLYGLAVPADIKTGAWQLFTEHEARSQARELYPKGGITIVSITDNDGNLLSQGKATCRMDENFNRHRALQIALGRATKKFHAAHQTLQHLVV